MLEKPFIVRLDPAFFPELLLPGRQRTTQIEEERKSAPDNREQVNPQKPGPDQHEKTPEHDEQNVRDMNRRDCARESPPDHVVVVGSNIGL